jgi:hypothetical protein
MFFYKAIGHSVERKFHFEHLLPAMVQCIQHSRIAAAAVAAAAATSAF